MKKIGLILEGGGMRGIEKIRIILKSLKEVKIATLSIIKLLIISKNKLKMGNSTRKNT